MHYVGIDPSTKTGLVILDEQGNVIHEEEITTKEKNDPQRFMNIADQIVERIRANNIGKEVKIMIEGFSYGSKGRAVSTQYGIGWIIRTSLIDNHLDYIEVTPGGLKKFATGKGNTKKDELVLPIFKRWNYEHSSDNVRDAFVLAQIGRYLDGHAEPTAFQKEVLTKIDKGETQG